ncbi:HalOD1 output domain-containing protein [Natrinema sp. SYSU A 869]|uniref:HalOD1 output domain-containing protein n=1 Tax=Natrinema sp. SYSU A 869 TaxID=2871694 RepID=UPI001CA437AA|nr:HalOD1 output domain-containing protein [Natrinema sp. SYSU A 869]
MNPHDIDRGGDIHVDYTEYESVSHALAVTIAAVEDIRVTELDPLFEYVHLEALNRLVQQTEAADDLIIDMIIDGHAVTIRDDGWLTVSESIT